MSTFVYPHGGMEKIELVYQRGRGSEIRRWLNNPVRVLVVLHPEKVLTD